MASQGPLFPGTITTQSVLPEDDNDWTTPGNVAADDGSEAQITAATYDANDISFRLKAQNFGFTIPAGATVNGIVVEIERRAFAGSAEDERVQLLDEAGAVVGNNKAIVDPNWPTTAAVQSYGGTTDVWGWTTVAEAKVNDVDFGVVLSVEALSANTDIGVDFIRVTIHYTPPAATLEGAVTGTATLAGLLTTAITLAGSILGQATVAAALATQIALGGAVTGDAAGSGALTTEILLAGAASGQATGAGELTVQAAAILAGTVTNQATGSGSLSTEIRLMGEASAALTASGALTNGSAGPAAWKYQAQALRGVGG